MVPLSQCLGEGFSLPFGLGWDGGGGPGLSWLFNRVQQRIRHHSRRQVAVS